MTIKRLPSVSNVTEIDPAVLEAVERIINVGARPRYVSRERIIQDPVAIKDVARTKVFNHIVPVFEGIPRSSFNCGDRRKSAVAPNVGDNAGVGRRNGGEGGDVVGGKSKASC